MPASRLRTPGRTSEPHAAAEQPLRENTLVPDVYSHRLDRFAGDFDRGGYGYGGYGFGFGGFGGYPADRTQDRSHAPLPYLTEQEYFRHITLSRDLVATNDLAIGFRSRVRQYVGPVTVSFVLAGQAPGAGAAGPVDADSDGMPDVRPEVAAAQEAWDEFCRTNDWGCGIEDREEECIDRGLTEGEVTVRLFKGAPGEVPRVRFIDPEFIRSPAGCAVGDPAYMGVITPRADAEEYTHVCVQCDPDDPTDLEEIDRTRVIRRKQNVPRSSKRGLSDFLPSAETIRKASELLDNMGITAGVQSKYAWMENFGPNTTAAQARSMIEAGRDYSAVKLTPFGGNKTVDVTRDPPGTIKRVEHDREFKPGPTATPDGFLAIIDAAMRRVSIRFGLPPNFIWASADSFASVLVTNAPFVMEIQERQKRQQGFTEELVRRVLALCEESGRLPRGISKAVRPVCDSSPVVTADEEKQARTELALFGQGLADPYRIMRENKDDPKIVYANLAAHKKKLAQMGGAPGGQQPPPDSGGAFPPGGEPTPAPPGSAGGDGSSPNNGADLFPESKGGAGNPGGTFPGSGNPSVRLTERTARKEGEKWNVGTNWYTKRDGKIRKTSDPSKVKGPTKKQQKAAAKADHAARQDKARAAVRKLQKGSGQFTLEDVKAIDDHFATLKRDEMRAFAKALGSKIGGPKREIAARLVARGRRATKGDFSPDRRRRAPEDSVLQQIVDYGGIDPKSHELLTSYEHMNRAVQDGVPLAAFKRGGMGLDALAQQLENAGHIRTPEGMKPGEYVIELLKKRAFTLSKDASDEYDAAYREYLDAYRDAETEHTSAEIADVVRRGEEDGTREADGDPLGQHGYSAGATADDLFADDPGWDDLVGKWHESVGAELDPTALALALAYLRGNDEDEAAAELLHLIGDTDAEDDGLAESRLREEQDHPPFPGAVFDKGKHRWVQGNQAPQSNSGLAEPASRTAAAAEHNAARTPERPQPKALRAARSFSDVARRRRVIHAVKNEGELAEAIGAWNLQDSEPADVVHMIGADGKPILGQQEVKQALRRREAAVKTLKTGKAHAVGMQGTIVKGGPATEEHKAFAEAVLNESAHFFEVKTLLTSPVGAVHINAKAMQKKQQWMDKYHVSFSVVAIDDRRGGKHSGNRVYVAPHELGGTTRLEHMKPVGMGDVLKAVQ